MRSWVTRIARAASQAWRGVRNEAVSIADPRLLEWLGIDWHGDGGDGRPLTESRAMTLSAFFRGCVVVAGGVGGLPLRTLRDVDGSRTRVRSVFDDPGSVVGLRPWNWKQLQTLHLILWGDAFLWHVYNVAGALVGLVPVHPSCVEVKWDRTAVGGKRFIFTDDDGVEHRLDATRMTHVMGFSLDGLRGLSVLTLARLGINSSIAAEKAANRMWRNGMMISAVMIPEEDVDPEEIPAAEAELNDRIGGPENAGKVRVINRRGKLHPLSMPAKDAQFLESRKHNIYDVARWLGVPASLLMDPDAVSTWGTGVEIQQRGLSRFTLVHFTNPMQEAYTSTIKGERFCEFDYAGLERGSPQEEISLLLQQVDGGLLTINEARKIRNLPPVEGGDVLRVHGVPVAQLPGLGETVQAAKNGHRNGLDLKDLLGVGP